ncbi:hypothetical protein D3C77_386690 [compost metagenome]
MAIYGNSREDVYNAYPDYNNHNAGFYFSLTLPKEDSIYILKLVVKNNNGDEVTLTRGFKNGVFKPIGEIESPEANGYVNYNIDYGEDYNTMQIQGWHLEFVKMKKIEIYIDGQLVIPLESSINLYRKDVHTKYPHYENQYSGYSAIITTPRPVIVYLPILGPIKMTTKDLTVIVENENGQRTTYYRSFTIREKFSKIIITDPCGALCQK